MHFRPGSGGAKRTNRFTVNPRVRKNGEEVNSKRAVETKG